MDGCVEFFDRHSGFGQILAGGRVWRFHRSDLVDTRDVETGAAVEFSPTEGPRGGRAAQVRLHREAPAPAKS